MYGVSLQISDEEAIIPGWEGKIVAWIEKDMDKVASKTDVFQPQQL